MEQGLIDANLGGGIIKNRVALPGRGKRGSTRTLVATNNANRWFFLFGFEKNERDIKRSHFAGGDLTPPLTKGDARPLWIPHLIVPASRGGG